MSSLITSLLFKILSTEAIETVLGIFLTIVTFPLSFGLLNENINYPQWKTNTVGFIQGVVALSGGINMYCNSSRSALPLHLIEEKPHQFDYWWFFCKFSLFLWHFIWLFSLWYVLKCTDFLAHTAGWWTHADFWSYINSCSYTPYQFSHIFFLYMFVTHDT